MGVRRWRGLPGLLTLLVVAASCARLPADAASRYRTVVRARSLFEAGAAKDAQRLLERMVEAERRPEALVNLGLVQHARGKREQAARSWSAALALNPADERALFHLAALRLEQATESAAGRHKGGAAALLAEARALAERAVGADAYNAAVQCLFADVLTAQGDTAAARPRREAERLDPGRGGKLARVFGFGSIALPELRHTPHFTRTPPRFATQALPVEATLALAVDVDGNGVADVVLGGSGAILKPDSARAEADVRWSSLNLLADSVVLATSAFFDADAVPDLFAVTRAPADSGRGPTRAWLVHGGAHPRCTLLGEVPDAVQALAPTDYDRDGDVDVLFAHLADSGLLFWRNDGNGRFEAADRPPGWAGFGAARAVLAADLDGDGAEDLLCMDGYQRVRVLGARPGGAFVETTLLCGLWGQRARAAACADLDGDGDADLLLGDDGGLWLWRNEGAGHFVRTGAYREVLADWATSTERGVPVAAIHVADLDNDGLLDVVTLHFASPPEVLATSTATAPTTEDTAPNPSRLAPLFDVPARTNLALWHNEGNALLFDVTPRSSSDAIVVSAAALASADFDCDGDLDLVGVGADSTLLFLWNVGGTVQRRVEIELAHAAAPAACFAARVEVYTRSASVSQVARGPVTWVGVGDAHEAEVLRIVWPDGSVQNHFDVTLPTRGRLRLTRARSS